MVDKWNIIKPPLKTQSILIFFFNLLYLLSACFKNDVFLHWLQKFCCILLYISVLFQLLLLHSQMNGHFVLEGTRFITIMAIINYSFWALL
jgi:hypothetical protein